MNLQNRNLMAVVFTLCCLFCAGSIVPTLRQPGAAFEYLGARDVPDRSALDKSRVEISKRIGPSTRCGPGRSPEHPAVRVRENMH